MTGARLKLYAYLFGAALTGVLIADPILAGIGLAGQGARIGFLALWGLGMWALGRALGFFGAGGGPEP